MTTQTTPETTTVTITSRSRNLGLGWTNQPIRHITPSGNSVLRIATPTAPDVTGSVGTIGRELAQARRINNSNHWAWALFVAGRPIVAYESTYFRYTGDDANDDDRYYDHGTWQTGWLEPNYNEILTQISQPGGSVTVRLG